MGSNLSTISLPFSHGATHHPTCKRAFLRAFLTRSAQCRLQRGYEKYSFGSFLLRGFFPMRDKRTRANGRDGKTRRIIVQHPISGRRFESPSSPGAVWVLERMEDLLALGIQNGVSRCHLSVIVVPFTPQCSYTVSTLRREKKLPWQKLTAKIWKWKAMADKHVSPLTRWRILQIALSREFYLEGCRHARIVHVPSIERIGCRGYTLLSRILPFVLFLSTCILRELSRMRFLYFAARRIESHDCARYVKGKGREESYARSEQTL